MPDPTTPTRRPLLSDDDAQILNEELPSAIHIQMRVNLKFKWDSASKLQKATSIVSPAAGLGKAVKQIMPLGMDDWDYCYEWLEQNAAVQDLALECHQRGDYSILYSHRTIVPPKPSEDLFPYSDEYFIKHTNPTKDMPQVLVHSGGAHLRRCVTL